MAAFLAQSMSLSSTMSSFAGSRMATPTSAPVAARVAGLTIECAHKKGAGSTKNGRDSRAQRLGVKVYGDQEVKAGGIIIRQRGYSVHCGPNTFVAKDYTIHSKIDGVVRFKKTAMKKSVYVEEAEEVEYDRTADTRKNRRLAKFPPRDSILAAAQ
eukprot:CAMPEP_0198231710 /NCGR_PEP_ID=MMETSP1445-20131203/115340_1 /TAXON_ID=36898 /ORGANISM="Pyramimonas sp., Strain CCMP2087" /LENGTH=155 /DNA_ID=CAMNT_0043912339 /DNA_START=648 /DNA_END=1115 /DNA_ORIENTATION=-